MRNKATFYYIDHSKYYAMQTPRLFALPMTLLPEEVDVSTGKSSSQHTLSAETQSKSWIYGREGHTDFDKICEGPQRPFITANWNVSGLLKLYPPPYKLINLF